MRRLLRTLCPILLLGVIGFALGSLVGPVLAIVALPLTRAAIMQIAVIKTLSAKQLQRVPALFMTAWIYFAVIAAGQTAVGVPLLKWGINLDFVNQRSASWEGAAQTMILRIVDALSLISNSAVKDALPDLRNQAYAQLMQEPEYRYEQHLIDQYGSAASSYDRSNLNAQTKASGLKLLALGLLCTGGVAVIFAAETLFAFRSLINERPIRAFALSLRHFGIVAGHLWLLRLVIVGLKVLFVFAPLILVDEFRYLAVSLNWFDSPVQVAILTACLAGINAVFMTFEAVYAARLFIALTTEQPAM